MNDRMADRVAPIFFGHGYMIPDTRAGAINQWRRLGDRSRPLAELAAFERAIEFELHQHRWLRSPKLIPAGRFHPAICFDCGVDKSSQGNGPCPGVLARCESCRCVVTRCACPRWV